MVIAESRHPLADVVLAMLQQPETSRLDSSKLCMHLFGDNYVGFKQDDYKYSDSQVLESYRCVAAHILKSMHESGLVVRDAQGWFILAKS